jgi:hypothetical protein
MCHVVAYLRTLEQIGTSGSLKYPRQPQRQDSTPWHKQKLRGDPSPEEERTEIRDSIRFLRSPEEERNGKRFEGRDFF